MSEPEALTVRTHYETMEGVDGNETLHITYTAESFPEVIALDAELIPAFDPTLIDVLVRAVIKAANGIATYEYRSGDATQGSAITMRRVRFKEIKA